MSTAPQPLSLEEAIRTAIEYETKVRNMYRDAVELATEEVGKRIRAEDGVSRAIEVIEAYLEARA